MKIYLIPDASDITNYGKFFHIENLSSYDNGSAAAAAGILIGTEQDLPLDTAYKICCFPVNPQLRRKILKENDGRIRFSEFFDSEILYRTYMELWHQLTADIGKSYPEIYVAVNLSFGDFCLLAPVSLKIDPSKLKAASDIIHAPKMPEDIWKSDAELEKMKKDILRRVNTQHIYKLTNCKSLFTKLLDSEIDTPARAWELARQACVLLYIFLEESAHVWYDANGETATNPYEMEQDIIRSREKFTEYYYTFLKQAMPDNVYSDAVWSYSYFCNSLLYWLIGDSEAYAKGDYEEYRDFHGFFPIIAKETESLESFYCEQHGIFYAMGFLSVPASRAFPFWDTLPALIHEFSHYIPTPERVKRNHAVLELVFSSVFEPLITAAKKDANDIALADSISARVMRRFDELAERFIPGRSIRSESKDSMFFLNESMNLFEIMDFEALYKEALLADGVVQTAFANPDEVKEACTKRWQSSSTSYLLTYTMALREIRSDIAMCKLLNIGLQDYIHLMANEMTWATHSSAYTADSVILRFGFMTRYLYHCALKSIPPYQISDCHMVAHHAEKQASFNQNWKNCLYTLLKDAKKSDPAISDRLDNMKKYLERYIDINLNGESENGASVFENKLYPFHARHKNQDVGIVSAWIRQFDERGNNDFIWHIEKEYQRYAHESSNAAKVLKNYKARLVMRDLFDLLPDI